VVAANNPALQNPPNYLLPAKDLYANKCYRLLFTAYRDRLYILSAGWGLVKASYRLPDYDISFSNHVPGHVHRRLNPPRGHPLVIYNDYNHLACLPLGNKDTVRFIGGKSYHDFFCRLTAGINAKKIIYYHGGPHLAHPKLYRGALPNGYTPSPFITQMRTNWQYDCAAAIMTPRHPDYVP
jgi:hypothetical protein